jgi:antirestriction protein ArdC
MHHTDIITKKEAEALGIIGNDGLGFIKPQTAFKNITEQILAEIKKGNLVWRKGWRSGVVIKGKTYGAQNYETQRPYTGGNAFFINMQNLLNGTDYRFFLTHKQIKERGASLKQGAKPFPVSVFIKNVTTKEIVVKGEKKEINTEEAGVIWYYVYPIDLVEGLKEIKRITHKPDTFDEIVVTDAETIINNMPKAPPIKHGGNEAYWTPDRVQMPLKKAFKIPQQYYSTLFHELTHSTGYKTRLDRDMSGKFGSKPYALEELIAEISAAYLCGVCEIDYYTVNNSAAYLKSWANRLLTEIASDPNFLKRAVFKAARAATFIIGKTLEKHGIVVKLGGKKEVVKPEEKPHKGKEITPNKTVKASVNKAIEDLRSLPKYKQLSAMFLGMFYSDFKNADTIENVNGALKAKMYEKFGGKFLDVIDFDDYNKPTAIEYAQLSEEGQELINKIKSRMQTLKAKKSGTDLFPELAGTKNDFNLSSIIGLNVFGKHEHSTITGYKVISKTNIQVVRKSTTGGLIKTTSFTENQLKDLIAGKKVGEYEFIKPSNHNLKGVTDAVLVFINAFLSTHNKTVTKEDLAYMLATFQSAIKSGVVKAKHPLATIANQTQDKLVNVINKLRPNEKIKIQISNKQEIENKVMGLHGLGFWNVIAATVIGKAAEHLTHKHLNKNKPEAQALSGVMSVTDAINSKYDLIGLDGDYLKLIGEACKPTSFFIYGPGGSGKSSFTLLFSNYMAKKGNKMLYVAGEQFATPVFSKMLQRLKIEDSPNFVIVKSIETVPLKGFDFIVIDSKDSLNFELNDFIALKKNNPNLSFVILSQATKDGGFTGSEKWRNEVDTLLYCEDLVVHSNLDKNRWGGSAQFSILKIK